VIYQPFQEEVESAIQQQSVNAKLKNSASAFLEESVKCRYPYNFKWMGRPIIQFPQDIVAFQEIVFDTKPDLIIETGIAHGGSLMLSASMLAMLDIQEGNNPNTSKRKVIGIDIDIRDYNREEIENHFLFSYINLIESSSIDTNTITKVTSLSQSYKSVMVCLDSNHTHDHVLAELKGYAELTSKGNYCIVFDTVIEELKGEKFENRPWSVGNNPLTAVNEYLRSNTKFLKDELIDAKLQISVARNGYLKRVLE